VTLKKLPAHKIASKDEANVGLNSSYCLVRATNGKQKISCVLSSGEHLRFHMDLMTLLRASADGLKKKAKTKKLKSSLV